MKSTLRVFQSFRKKILNFIRPSQISFFDIHNPKGIKLITRLRLGLSHLRDYKFKHSFQDTINPLCNCGQDIESTTHLFLHCPFFFDKRHILLSTIRRLDSTLLDFTDYDPTHTLLFGNTSQTSSNNFKIINTSMIIFYWVRDLMNHFLNKFFHQLISKFEFNQQFSFLHLSIFCFTYIFIIVISCYTPRYFLVYW